MVTAYDAPSARFADESGVLTYAALPDPAPTTTLRPMRAPGRITAPAPSHARGRRVAPNAFLSPLRAVMPDSLPAARPRTGACLDRLKTCPTNHFL